MGDLISRSRLLDSLHREDTRLIGGNHYIRLSAAEEKIRIAPTVDAVEVVHGRWVYDRPNHYKCCVCDAMWSGVVRVMKFCPNCGAKMDGGADNG